MPRKKKLALNPVDAEIARVQKRILIRVREIDAAERKCHLDTAAARAAIQRHEAILRALRAGRHK